MNKFERSEKKYVLNQNVYEQLMERIMVYLQPDVYHQYTIHNIYLDTQHFDLISRSLERPAYKEKVRIRRYSDGDAFIELKKKYKKIVYKRRVPYPMIEPSQIKDEIEYTIQHYQLQPALYLAYDRIAWVAKDDHDLRITFDSRLRYRFSDLSLADTLDNQYYFNDAHYIMEIKIPGGMPLWLSHLLTDLHIYPTSFSKYGKIYQKEKENLQYV